MNESWSSTNVKRELRDLLAKRSSYGEFLVSPFVEIQNSYLSVFRDQAEVRIGILIDTEALGLPDLLFAKLQFRTLVNLELSDFGSKKYIPVGVFISFPEQDLDDFVEILSELTQAHLTGASIGDFYELVRLWASALGRPYNLSENNALGLWGELCVAALFKDAHHAIDAWHVNSTDPWDFVLEENMPLEIKTTSQMQRIHTFSSNQIGKHTPAEACVISLQTVRTDIGTSAFDLISELRTSLNAKSYLTLLKKVSKTCPLGSIELKSLKWDREMALDGLRLFSASQIESPMYEDPILRVTWSINLDKISHQRAESLELKVRKHLLY
jgi:hypothetical protein